MTENTQKTSTELFSAAAPDMRDQMLDGILMNMERSVPGIGPLTATLIARHLLRWEARQTPKPGEFRYAPRRKTAAGSISAP